MEFLAESPLTVGIAGLCSAVLAGFLWTQSGSKAAGGAAIAIVLATLGLVLYGVQVETDEERIRNMLHEVADGLERNDHAFVISHIHPDARVTVQRAKSELPRYKFTEARVTRIKSVTIESNNKPESAVVEFNVIVDLSFEGFKGKVPRFVKIYLFKHQNRWLVHDYEHFEPTAGFRE